MQRIVTLCLGMVLLCAPAIARSRHPESRSTVPTSPAGPAMRDLDWDTYLDKVEGAWMGKMIGVTFGAPWEFRYQNVPIGIDITDWPLSKTRMKDYRSRHVAAGGEDRAATTPDATRKCYPHDGFIQ